MRNRFAKPRPVTIVTVELPDAQRFVGDKVINITRASNVLTINLAQITALTYTAATSLGAYQVEQAIYAAITGNVPNVVIEESTPDGGVTITSYSPDPISSAGGEALVVTGTGFTQVLDPHLYVIYPGGGGGPIPNEFPGVVTVDDTTLNVTTVALVAGTYDFLLTDGPYGPGTPMAWSTITIA